MLCFASPQLRFVDTLLWSVGPSLGFIEPLLDFFPVQHRSKGVPLHFFGSFAGFTPLFLHFIRLLDESVAGALHSNPSVLRIV